MIIFINNNKNNILVWFIKLDPIKNITKLYKIIKLEEKLFENFFVKLFPFFLKKLNNNWCKCALSGCNGSFLITLFLIIENKFSKAGYQSNKAIKYGDKK